MIKRSIWGWSTKRRALSVRCDEPNSSSLLLFLIVRDVCHRTSGTSPLQHTWKDNSGEEAMLRASIGARNGRMSAKLRQPLRLILYLGNDKTS